MRRSLRAGTSLIDLLISMAIIALLFGGIYLVYFSLITSLNNVGVRTAATSAIQSEIETIRNLPYADVGTVGGIPAGIIPQVQAVTSGNYNFILQTRVLNIADPLDHILEADYKMVSVNATCPLCNSPVSVTVTTTVAPENLTAGTGNGSLFVYALDANGNPVGSANVQVMNASVTPSINLTDTTNASGVLQLIGAPTSTQGYQIIVSKPGYSTDQTYPPGGAGNPNPTDPNATIVAQTVTSATFSIDRLSSLTVNTSDNRCGPIGNEPFSFRGGKIIGTNPTVYKFATTSATSASGTAVFPGMEWDTYSFTLNDPLMDIAGTMPLLPLTINPSSTQNLQFILQPAADPSLLVTVTDAATGAGIQNASVNITGGSVNKTLTTGHAFVTQSDWSNGQYAAQSGGVDVGTAGKITLLANASGTYATSTNDWLISNTFDLGGVSSTLYTISWNPTTQPPNTTLQFQVAANNDNVTWNFIGPDGTGNTYFTVPAGLPAALSGNRYVRYKVFLNTMDGNATPELDSVTLEFNGVCVPPAQSLFTNLPQATYNIDVTAPNYMEATGTAAVGAGEATGTILMEHL